MYAVTNDKLSNLKIFFYSVKRWEEKEKNPRTISTGEYAGNPNIVV